MKILIGLTAGFACIASAQAQASDADLVAARWTAAMQSARWTGPLLASTAETLPHGHVYTEPYFFDGISGGEHSPGTSGFYQYGITDNWTAGVQPFFSLGTRKYNHEIGIGDTKLMSQVRLWHFSPEHRHPSVALVTNLVIPTGKYDHLGALKDGHGSGSFAPEVGLNAQQYFMLGNGRLLRARINVLQRFPLRTDVNGRSVYGTDAGFSGHAKPGTKTTLVLGSEYSLTKEWVLAFDIESDRWGKTNVVGRETPGGPSLKQTSPPSWNIGVAPAIEYNWSARGGAIFGVWIVPKGHNAPSSITPAIAIQRFW